MVSRSKGHIFKKSKEGKAYRTGMAADGKVAQGDLERRRTCLTEMYYETRCCLRGCKVTLASSELECLGTVYTWNCKEVWIDIVLSVPYGGKQTGEIYRFRDPRLIDLMF